MAVKRSGIMAQMYFENQSGESELVVLNWFSTGKETTYQVDTAGDYKDSREPFVAKSDAVGRYLNLVSHFNQVFKK